ncbi:MAG: hypothetical protein KGO49_06735 [Gammaproteobacteria bacterium]|nr:hypothetical protein [Gammaproteobacteria bacterium]
MKTIYRVCFCCMLVGLLTACGGGDSSQNGNSGGAASTNTQAGTWGSVTWDNAVWQ